MTPTEILNELSKAITALNTILLGDGNTNITLGGVVKPSITKHIETALSTYLGAIGVNNASLFETKALMTASSLSDNSFAVVYGDATSTNNGYYVKKSGSWTLAQWNPSKVAIDTVKSLMAANPLYTVKRVISGNYTNILQMSQAGLYVCDSNTVAGEISGLPVPNKAFYLFTIGYGQSSSQLYIPFNPYGGGSQLWFRSGTVGSVASDFVRVATSGDVLDLQNKLLVNSSKNKFDGTVVIDQRLHNQYGVANVVGAKRTGYIRVPSGSRIVISWAGSVPFIPLYGFFASKSDTLAIAGGNAVNGEPILVPPNANYIVINYKSESHVDQLNNLQVEMGWAPTEYSSYDPSAPLIIDPSIVVLEKAPNPDYVIEVQPRNLLDPLKVRDGKYVSSTGLGISSSAGWGCSGYIPVVEGESYTISGNIARQGLIFLKSESDSDYVPDSYNGSSSYPLTVVAPPSAKFMVINLYSATNSQWSNVQVEKGTIATPYTPYGGVAQFIDPNYIWSNGSGGVESSEVVNLNNGVGYITSEVDGVPVKLNVRANTAIDVNRSSAFNFANDFINNATVRVNGDDIAPVRMMGFTIGANHGYTRSNVTMSGHDKTASDIGSTWTDGTYEWVIVGVSSTIISLVNKSGNISFSSSLPVLSHVSGAINTSNITPTAVTNGQWYPMLKNHSLKITLDGLDEVDTLDKSYKDNVTFRESYDLMERADIIDWVIQNKGSLQLPYLAESALSLSMSYVFKKNGLVLIPSDMYVKKDLSASQDIMFTQSARMNATNGVVKYYVPRSVPFVHEGVNYDFRVPTDVRDLVITNRIDFTESRTEIGKAVPDRLVMLSGDYGYAVGYLPVLDAHPSVRNQRTSKGIQISNSAAKVYPYLVDGLESTPLTKGSHYSAVAYRKYFKRPSNPNRICDYLIESDYGDFLFMDWSAGDQIDEITLPNKLVGKKVEVIEKSDSVELMTASSGKVAVDLATVVGSAYLVLRFS